MIIGRYYKHIPSGIYFFLASVSINHGNIRLSIYPLILDTNGSTRLSNFPTDFRINSENDIAPINLSNIPTTARVTPRKSSKKLKKSHPLTSIFK